MGCNSQFKDAVQERPLTSEDLALGVPAALRFTAENTLRVAASKMPFCEDVRCESDRDDAISPNLFFEKSFF